MRKALIAIGLLSIAAPALAQGAHMSRGYTRSDGTYVAPHMSTNANGNAYDNWSSRPNTNPYTGQAGTRDPSTVNEYGTPGYGHRSSNGYGE